MSRSTIERLGTRVTHFIIEAYRKELPMRVDFSEFTELLRQYRPQDLMGSAFVRLPGFFSFSDIYICRAVIGFNVETFPYTRITHSRTSYVEDDEFRYNKEDVLATELRTRALLSTYDLLLKAQQKTTTKQPPRITLYDDYGVVPTHTLEQWKKAYAPLVFNSYYD